MAPPTSFVPFLGTAKVALEKILAFRLKGGSLVFVVLKNSLGWCCLEARKFYGQKQCAFLSNPGFQELKTFTV